MDPTMNKRSILCITAGGTILQRATSSGMAWSVSAADLIKQFETSLNISFTTLYTGLAANFRLSDVLKIAHAIQNDTEHGGFLITLGTDVIEEVAFALDYLLDDPPPVVIVGAMRPADALGYDGVSNLQQAISLLDADHEGPLGIVVCIGEQIHSARHVFKHDSEHFTAFRSHPGPIGDFRNGRPIIRFRTAAKDTAPGILGYLNADLLNNLRVPIHTLHTDASIELEWASRQDGIVLAGMGTGSVPDQIREALAREQTKRIPIVISTRCQIGSNYNDWLYKNSLAKYEGVGFLLRDFFGLNALQARIKLHLELAAYRAGASRLPVLRSFSVPT